jgi:predicted dehydrogenase
MKIYRTAIVGARRGLHHAACYEGIENMKVVALCEKVPDKLEADIEKPVVLTPSSAENEIKN